MSTEILAIPLFAFVIAIGPFFALGLFLGKGKRLSDLKALDQIGRDLPTFIGEYQAMKRRADEYLSKIEEVIMERETWRKLYNDQAGGHDNAQALMLQAITGLVHLYQKETGKTPRLDPLIEMVRGEWVNVHGPEARATLGDDGKAQEKPS